MIYIKKEINIMRFFNVFVSGLICFFHMSHSFKGVMAFHKVSKHLQNIKATEISDDHQTGYHFQTKQNWINGNFVVIVFATYIFYIQSKSYHS